MANGPIVLSVALQRYIDFTPVALRAREAAIAMAQARGTALEVVTSEAPVSLMPDAQTTAEKLERFLVDLRGKGIEVNGHLLQGRPSEVVIPFLVSVGADMLVIGSHSKRGPLDVGLGGNATAMVNNAPCCVLMIWPTQEEAERARELMIPGLPFVFPYG